MSVQEAEALVTWGRHWHSHVWIRNDGIERDNLIQHVNNNLNAIGFRLGRGWQNYDPVIRRAGRPNSYSQIATWAYAQPDHGIAMAQLFLDWARGNNVTLPNLPTELQDLAIITHLAEVGRGYSASLEQELYPWLEGIVGGQATWHDYRDFSPSLTFAEDSRLDWDD